MKAMLEFPIKHIDGNLVFGLDGTVTAYFKIAGFNYDFLSHDDKFKPFEAQRAFLFNNRSDLHFVSEPFPTNIDEIIKQTIEEIEAKDYELKESGLAYMQFLQESLKGRRESSEANDYAQYIGVQLHSDRNRFKDANVGMSTIYAIKEFFNGLMEQSRRATGLHATDILESEIMMWRTQAETVLDALRNAFQSIVVMPTTVETVRLIEKEFSVLSSNLDVENRFGFESAHLIEQMGEDGNMQRAYRPNYKSFLQLRETNIEEVSPTTLKFSRAVDGQIKHLYARYLVVHAMDSENHFPNFEWLYYLQSNLSFPVSTSIRAYYQSNERIVKRLSNKRLEYRDQKEEAMRAGSATDLSLNQSEVGTIQTEAYFQKSGQPAYASSIVFKITAESEQELEMRAQDLQRKLINFGIKIVAPFGEQLSLMMERVLGSRQLNNDYQIEMDAGVLAGMMFGATSSIGDGRGFFIGYTERLNNPVFIQPDLAAKSFDGLGNLEDSISALVAGATGKGKSFFMNLYSYLSALTGSHVLIIDPKGDRKNWDSLPLISGEYISKWTLGSSKEDAGCLDPFRTSPTIEEAKSISLDILSFLTNTKIEHIEYAVLSEAIEYASDLEDPCVGGVITYIERLAEQEATMTPKRFEAVERLRDMLLTLQKQPLASLLFGTVGQNYRALSIEKPIQILMVENLVLPEMNSKSTRPNQKISEAILISITAFTKQYMFKHERGKHKIVLQDEASTIDQNEVGRELMDFIVRKGRYYNTTLLKGSQNATDHVKDVANMGMKFSFGLRTKEEATEMLEFLNLPETKVNIDKIRQLSKGKCLFQDIYGRSAVVQIDPVFPDLYEAFDSSTSTEEERLRERKRMYGESK